MFASMSSWKANMASQATQGSSATQQGQNTSSEASARRRLRGLAMAARRRRREGANGSSTAARRSTREAAVQAQHRAHAASTSKVAASAALVHSVNVAPGAHSFAEKKARNAVSYANSPPASAPAASAQPSSSGTSDSYAGKPQFVDPALRNVTSWDVVNIAASSSLSVSKLDALGNLNKDTVYELLDSGVVLDVATDAGVSDMSDIVSIVDEHVRCLYDAIVNDNDATLTTRCYEALEKLPPLLGSQQRAAKAALGGAALEEMREEAEMKRSIIDEALDGVSESDDSTLEARRERDAAVAIIDGIDAVLARLPFEGKMP
uniref:Uncharacterized protein n=1 Tax=Pycnococcus provasolii TaxID=41880 RepID=A0A7S2FG72_9CHLO|mmetsp:Transcript_7729/g.17536  ORF Transcript_7729/g.17536 Transcript_7729/m.17536 type:complete len:320 (-) Transcript_7729:38-997(-)